MLTRWVRRRRGRTVAAVLVVLLAGAGLTAWFALGGGGLPVGSTVTGSGAVDGQSVAVPLPYGSLEFRIADPVDELSDDDVASGQAPAAARGGRFLAISWELSTEADPMPYALGATPDLPTARLVTGNGGQDTTRTILGVGVLLEIVEGGSVVDQEHARHLVIPAQLVVDDLDLEVTLAAVTHRVDLATGEAGGPFVAAFSGEPRSAQPAECPGSARVQEPADYAGSLEGTVRCDVVAALATRYLSGLGWAGTGTSWVVLEVSQSLTVSWLPASGAGPAVGFWITALATTLLLDSLPPVAELGRVRTGTGLTITAVFELDLEESAPRLGVETGATTTVDPATVVGQSGYPTDPTVSVSISTDVTF